MRRITTSLGLIAVAALVASCGGSSDTKSAQVPGPVFNEVVHEGMNVPLVSSPGYYQLSVGPLDVRKYSEIRVYAFGNSGSGIISVAVTATDAEGIENHGGLDAFDLNMSGGGNNWATRAFDLPGEYIKVDFRSVNAGAVSLIVYGRTSE